MEGRGVALEKIRDAMDADEADAARAIIASAASRCAERGLLAGVGVNLEALGRLSSSDQGDDRVQALYSEAETRFAESGDIARQGRCQATLATLRWYAAQEQPGLSDTRVTARAYRDAADLCRRAGDWLGYGAIMRDLADLLDCRGSPSASQRNATADSVAAYADAAAAFARADDASDQGRCLLDHVHATNDTCRSLHDWCEIATVLRQAETCFSRGDEVGPDATGRTRYDVSWWRLLTECGLAEAQSALDDSAGAHATYALLEQQLDGLDGRTTIDLRRRMRLGLRTLPP
jgi:hypothetical protein